ncbi:MAG: PDZ domain-containing protein [Okeania sp. SIO3B5]|uniref:nSTAND1 domain-containing NTPase n=1 Tax=Okeania sp. SIO3B5 TaxID=2607811 RepID=UPI0014000EEC|nr:PDZ domain-containing protein [Okeania sp. SIO3B5]NEO52251.1 PDZ domain-containing protein [Okeania sp. SIO3B5]
MHAPQDFHRYRGQDAHATRFSLFNLYVILINLGAVMGKLVTLNIDGGFHEGFSVRGEIWQDVDSIKNEPSLAIASKSAHLPPHSEILEQYRHWQSLYTNLDVFFSNRLKSKAGFTNISDNDKNGAFAACKNAANLLAQTFNTWLNSSDFQSIEILLRNYLDKSESTRILLATENYGLRRLPWHEWDFLKDFPKAEIALATPNFQRVDTAKKLDKKDKIKILVILGDNAGTDADEEVIRKLIPDAEICWLIEPQRSELDEPLWQKSWDILFFAGHGKTKDNGSIGTIQINGQDVLTISEIKNHLLQAVKSGLKLAIFNACNGLGLAYQLAEGEDLHLPQIIVMRENLPVVIAPNFLQFFLENYTQGLSLYSSLRESRQRLQILEKDFPCVSWLPVLCQNPAEIPPRWLELGGKIQISPYKGLSAFTENDTEIFFGRKVLTNSLLEKVDRQNLVAVIGASGSGKSSLVAAGLIPQWLAQATEILPRFVVKIRPGFPHPNPWENLAEELGKISPNLTANNSGFGELVANLETNSGKLAKCLTGIVQEKKGCQILLVIDQFEELYTLCSEEKRRSFLAGLVDAVRDDSWKIVLTLRADFLSQALDEDLGKIFDERDKLITPMNDEELKEAIALPAEKFEVEFADELIKRMIQDYRQNSGHLPMLQFALEELWKKQKYGVISLASYEEIGGLTQVLGDYAEKIYIGLSQEEKEQARYIFTQLVQPISQEKSGEVSRIATRKIATFADIGKENWQLVIKFADERLVVTNKEKDVASVELIHEVLITAWSRLKKWIEQDWEFRRWQEKLRDNLSQWEKEKKDEYLLQGGLLKEAESWLEKGEQKIPEKERGYVDKSRKRRERERQKLIYGLAGGLAIVSFSLVGVAWQWQRAERQSLINEAENLSNLALNQFQSGEGGISALMTAMDAGQKLKKLVKDDEKLGNYPTTQPLLALQTITSNIREKNVLESGSNTSAIYKVLFAPDGKQIVSLNMSLVGKNHQFIIQSKSGEKIAEWDVPEGVFDFAISPDGKYIAAMGINHLYLMDFSGKQIAQLDNKGYLGSVYSSFSNPKFSPDSQYIALRSASYILTETGEGKSITKLRVFNLSLQEVGELTVSENIDESLFDFDFVDTNDSQQIVTGNPKGMVEYWNLKTFKKLREFQANTNGISQLIVSPNDKKILTLGTDVDSSDKIAKLWNFSGQEITRFYVPNIDGFYTMSFSPDSKQIAIGIQGAKIEVESSDQKVAQSSGTGIIKLYDAITGLETNTLTVNGLSSNAGLAFSKEGLSYSHDSQTIAMADSTEIKLLNVTNNNSNFIELPKIYEKEQFVVSGKKISTIKNFQYSTDGQKLLVQDSPFFRNNLDIWNWSEKEVKTFEFSEGDANIHLAPDRKSFGFINEEGIQKRNLENQLISQIKINPNELNKEETVFESFYPLPKSNLYTSSYDGEKIATIGVDTTFGFSEADFPVHLWNLSTKEFKRLIHPSLYRTRKVVMSPNGKYLVTLSGSGNVVRIWDEHGNLLNPLKIKLKSFLPSEESEISVVAIMLDNRQKVKVFDVWENSTARKTGLKNGDIILSIDEQNVSGYSIEEIYSLLKGEPGTSVKIKVKSRDDKIEEKIIVREKLILDRSNYISGYNAKFSPDSKHLITWYPAGKELNLRNLKNNQNTTIQSNNSIFKIYFSPDSKLITGSGLDYSVKIWDTSGKLITQIKLEKQKNTLNFSPDSQKIAVLSHLPNELTVWSIDGKKLAKFTIPERNQYHNSESKIVFSPDGKYIAVGTKKVMIWRYQNLNELLATGCDWLQEYLTTRPEEKDKLKVCQEEVK